MATRMKKVVVATPSEAEAREELKAYAQSQSKLKKIEAEIELAVQKIRDRHKSNIANLMEQRDMSFEKLKAYAEGNRETLFTRKKSIDWGFGVLGYRIGTPKVEKIRGVTWDALLGLLKGAGFDRFVRAKEDVDKEKIIASREDIEVMANLGKLGISVVQDETFFVEAKEEDLVS